MNTSVHLVNILLGKLCIYDNKVVCKNRYTTDYAYLLRASWVSVSSLYIRLPMKIEWTELNFLFNDIVPGTYLIETKFLLLIH